MKTLCFQCFYAAVLLAQLSLLCAQTIRVQGTDLLAAKVMPQFAEAYHRLHPDIDFSLNGEGSSQAFAYLSDDLADIGMSIRDANKNETAKLREQSISLKKWLAGYDAYAIAVHRDNPASNLSSDQLKAIFLGQVNDWQQIVGSYPESTPIQVTVGNTMSASSLFFRQTILSGRSFVPGSSMTGNTPLIDAIADDPNRIGIIGFAERNAPGIKVLSIGGVHPNDAISDEYPLRMPIWYFSREGAPAYVTDFLQWATTAEEAKKILLSTNLIPGAE